MAQGITQPTGVNAAAQAILRLLIASYFLAVALQLIPGTDLGLLFTPVLPAPFDSALATGIVFILAFLIMAGTAVRLAALMMALMTFYASYLAMLSLGVGDELGAFWRDLALIAALLLTYPASDRAGRAEPRRRLQRHVAPRRIPGFSIGTLARRPLRPMPAVGLAALQAQAQPVRRMSEEATIFALRRRRHGASAVVPVIDPLDEVDNLFADDAGTPA
ncbi:hypothetical protein [Roseicyclus persicicus]|uniref:DoxX family protein n=1 Tax=Roseicyclus persicicus TaxID=2650661 RepID=A0A7X6H1T4_9RHOB|nr:hypothetical protein [Roseibacterium persicicum]NKX46479.1 hypothetical protein [Roseibacterium persicicum]